MNKQTSLNIAYILLITLLAGIFYNFSNPNRIQFVANEKVVDFSASDSLLNALRIQDSLQKAADSLLKLTDNREDSLRIALEKLRQDSILTAKKSDSLNHIQDSIKTAIQKKQDSINSAKTQVTDIVKPIDIKIDFAKALFDKNFRFIDARDVADFNAGHIQGAINIPFHEIDKHKNKLIDLPKDQVYITYCSSDCDVSIDMAYYMAKMGFIKVYIFHGGWDVWKAAGYPAN